MTRTSSASREPQIALSVAPADEVKTTTCYMCACRCGIDVHLKDGKVRYIEGNRDHPVNRGVLCGKGSAGIMQHYSPARLRKPLLRVGERGSGEFREIDWDEALATRRPTGSARSAATDPRQARLLHRPRPVAVADRLVGEPVRHAELRRAWRLLLGQHGGGGPLHHWRLVLGIRRARLGPHALFHAVRRRRGSRLPTRSRSASASSRQRGAKFVSINPVRTGYSAIADEWIGIRPGTDGLFVCALIHELLRRGQVDLDYLVRYTNAPWLVIAESRRGRRRPVRARCRRPRAVPGTATTETFAARAAPAIWSPLLSGAFDAAGRPARRAGVSSCSPSAISIGAYSPERVAERDRHRRRHHPAHRRRARARRLRAGGRCSTCPGPTGLGRRHDNMIGRPVSMHAMRGISAHSNGFHTCRAIHLLQILLGTIDCPGGFRYKPPYPKPIPPRLKPRRQARRSRAGRRRSAGRRSASRPVPKICWSTTDGTAAAHRQGLSWEAPLAAHGLMHMVIPNAWRWRSLPDRHVCSCTWPT